MNVLQSQLVQREVADDLQERLTAAEQALVAKQNAIDKMKQELYSQEKDLETISVFQAQVCCRFLFSFLVWLKVSSMFSVCLLLIPFCRRRSIPLTSTPKEQPGRSSMRRKSVWPPSWSTSRSRTRSSRMRLIHLAGKGSNWLWCHVNSHQCLDCLSRYKCTFKVSWMFLSHLSLFSSYSSYSSSSSSSSGGLWMICRGGTLSPEEILMEPVLVWLEEVQILSLRPD